MIAPPMPAAPRDARSAALGRAFGQPVSGPTYRPLTRALALLLVLGILGWGLRSLGGAGPMDSTRLAALAILVAALLWPMPALLFGRTVLDAEGIRQTGWMGRDAAWAQVHRVRFVRLPLAPRLIVSVGFGRARVFQSGSAELDAAFEQAVRLLTGPVAPIDPDTPDEPTR